MTGLEGDIEYDCWFTACNDHPLWPICQEVSDTTAKLTKVSIKRDSAVILSIFGALFSILTQNHSSNQIFITRI